MPLQADSKTRDTKNNEKSVSAENSRETSRFSGIPNSFAYSAPLPPPGTPNSIMRILSSPPRKKRQTAFLPASDTALPIPS